MHSDSLGSKVLAACWHTTNIAILTNCKLGCSATRRHKTVSGYLIMSKSNRKKNVITPCSVLIELFCGNQHLWRKKKKKANQAKIKNVLWIFVKVAIAACVFNHFSSHFSANLTASLCGMAFWFLHAPFPIVSILHLSLSFMLVRISFCVSVSLSLNCYTEYGNRTKKKKKQLQNLTEMFCKVVALRWCAKCAGISTASIPSFQMSLWLPVAASCKQTHSINTIVLMAFDFGYEWTSLF